MANQIVIPVEYVVAPEVYHLIHSTILSAEEEHAVVLYREETPIGPQFVSWLATPSVKDIPDFYCGHYSFNFRKAVEDYFDRIEEWEKRYAETDPKERED